MSCDQISKSQISGASDLPPSPWGTLPGKNILESPESCFQTSDQWMLAECRVVEFLGAIFQSSQFYGGKAAWLGRPLQRWDGGPLAVRAGASRPLVLAKVPIKGH